MSRLTKKTPKFFRIMRNVGLALAGIGAAVLTAPVGLPAAVVTLAGYLSTAGAVAAAVAQSTKENE